MYINLQGAVKRHSVEICVNILAIFCGISSILFGILNIFSVLFMPFWYSIGGIVQIGIGVIILAFESPKIFFCCYDEDANDVAPKSYKRFAIVYCIIFFVPVIMIFSLISLIISGLILCTGIMYAFMACFLKPKQNVNFARNLPAEIPTMNQHNQRRKLTTLTNGTDNIIHNVDTLLDSNGKQQNLHYNGYVVDELPIVHGQKFNNLNRVYQNHGYYLDHYNNTSHGHQNTHDDT